MGPTPPLHPRGTGIQRGLDLLLAAGMVLCKLLLHELSDLRPLVPELHLQLKQPVVGLQSTQLSDQERKIYCIALLSDFGRRLPLESTERPIAS